VVWVLFTAPSPTPDGRSARDLYEKRVTWIDDAMRASAREIRSEPGEVAIELDGDVGLVPLGGDPA
jgi:hypothetical protein